MNTHDRDFWSQRWSTGETRWDVGHVSAPLQNYMDKLTDQSLRILIPGCGSGYEGEYLWRNGFSNVFMLDFAEEALQAFSARVPDFPQDQLICADFFSLENTFDLVLEQTFFCALQPSLRTKYVEQMHRILNPGGKLAGLLFNFPLSETGPPFGGSAEEYTAHFDPLFLIHRLEEAKDSIAPRTGNELFIELEKS